ncbi:MAG: hypothetical protein M0P64_00440 [Candidatus Pacebacteria bacterium]|jgi:hypothetical protein|nr:hypothetical protein [Candidatus Paceibacterota bacterium]
MDPVDEAFAREHDQQMRFILIVLLIIGANAHLAEEGIFRGTLHVIAFNFNVLLLWFSLSQRKIQGLYQKNLQRIKSSDTQGVKHDRNLAMEYATRGEEFDPRCS